MKTMKKNLFLFVLAFIATVCFVMGLIYAPNTSITVKADDIPTLNKTNFSVSTNETHILLATPISGSVDDIYEVGYTFTGEQPTLVQHDTKKYYTTINGKGAQTLFGGNFTDTTPMIVWEIENDADVIFNAQAYFKVGQRDGELLYPTKPETIVTATARNLKTYTVTWVDGDGETLKEQKVEHGTVPVYDGETPTKTETEEYVYAFNTWDNTPVEATADVTYTATFTQSLNPAITDVNAAIEIVNSKFTSATIENYLEISAEIAKIDGKINELSEVQKARISDYEKYKAIKSSYTLVYNMVGSDLKDKISVTGDGSSFDNVETHQYPDAFKPLSDQGIYGYCARVKTGGGTGVFKFQPTDAFKAMLDLSAYTHVLIGVRSETRTCTYKWSDGTNPRTLATSTNTTDFITLRLTVDEFLNGYIYVESGQSTFWFASIIAVYDPTTVITEIDAYLDALGDNNVTLENYKTYINAVTSIDAKLAANKDCNVLISNLSEYNAKRFKVVDNMLGSDLTTARFTVTGDRARDFLGPDSHSNPTAFAPVVHEGAYGKCARLRVKGGTEGIIKIKYNLTPDLSDYDYVYVGIYSEVGTATWYWKGADGQTNVATVAAEVGQCKVMKISVEDFLNGYLFTNGGANNDAYWLTPIIAIAE